MTDTPLLFKTQPFNHQLTCLTEFGPREYFALLAEQGTGKTWIIINNAARLWAEGKLDGVLVLAPNGVHYNWTEPRYGEITKHMPDWVRYVAAPYVAGANKKDRKAMERLLSTTDSSVLRILVANTESMQHASGIEFVTKFVNSCSRLMIAIDEAADFKTPQAKRVKELFKLKKYSCFRRIMDGTLITNGPFDAFAPFSFLDEDILQTTSYFAFKAEYAEMLPENHGLLRHIVEKKTRMSKADAETLTAEIERLNAMIFANGRDELMLIMSTVTTAHEAENYEALAQAIDGLRSAIGPGSGAKRLAVLQLMSSIDARIGAHLRTVSAAMNPHRLPQIVERDKEGKPKYRNLDKLHALIAPHTFRVLKKDCLDLPEKLPPQILWFDMTTEQQKAYDKAADENRLALDGIETPFNKLVAQMKLMQITTGYYLHPDQEEPVRIPGRNPKLELLVERAKSLKERGKKIMAWARFRVQIEDVCKALRAEGMKVMEYHGGINKKGREESKNEFEHGDADVIVLQQQAGGKGLTFVSCHNVFYFSNDYSLRNRLQSEDRVHRIGQTEDVHYTDFCARNSVDAECLERLRDKEFIAKIVVGDEHKIDG